MLKIFLSYGICIGKEKFFFYQSENINLSFDLLILCMQYPKNTKDTNSINSVCSDQKDVKNWHGQAEKIKEQHK